MRLPDIDYQAGNVRPLAKEDTSLPRKAAQVEVDLSKARLGAELGAAADIANANIRLAREMGQVERQAAWDQAKIAIDSHSHNIQMRAMGREATVGLLSNLAGLTLQTASSWYQANEEAKAAKGSALYSAGLAELTAKLENSSTVNLSEYPDIDFSGIPENMIYEGVDSVTGQKIRSAPNHIAAPLVYAAQEKKLYEAASEGIGSQLAQAKFAHAIQADQERGAVSMITSKAKHERNFLQGQYEQALTTRVDSGDMAGAIDTINSAEARGIWNAEEAGKKRKDVIGDVVYSRLIKAVDTASSMGQLQEVREAAYNLPKEQQTSIRSAINMRENEFEKIADRQRTQAEHALVGLNKLQASQVAIAEGGLKDYGKGVAAITKQFGGDPHLDDYITEWRQNFNTLQSQEKAQKSQAVSEWYKDPSKPIPAWAADGKDLREMEKFQREIKSGKPVMTDMETYTKLQRMAGEDPEQFKKMDLNLMRAALDDGDMKHFAGIQSKMLEDGGKPVQVATANAVWDNAANQMWGKEGKRSDKEQAQADGAYRAFTVMVEQAVEANNGKPLQTSQMQQIADDVFRAKHQATVYTTKGWNRVTNKQVTIADPDVSPYLPALTGILQNNRVPITSEALLREYEAWLKSGRLEELR